MTDDIIRDYNVFKEGLDIFYGKNAKREMRGCLSWVTANLPKQGDESEKHKIVSVGI